MKSEADIAVTVLDAAGTFVPPQTRRFGSSGVAWLNNTTGALTRAFEVYEPDPAGKTVTLRKANGLGDIEILCDSAPIEIGNYVWLDSNRNGVQDAGETPFANVVVRLYTPGPDGNFGTPDDVPVATTTTDSAGRYYFTNLLPLTRYQVRIDTAQTPLIGYLLTVTDADSTPNGDSRDNDGLPQGLDAVITLTTGLAGDNNHTYDFGFVEAPTNAELEYFRIDSASGGKVNLAWQTVSETDHFGFELVRANTARPPPSAARPPVTDRLRRRSSRPPGTPS